MNEEKHIKFKELAEKRMSKVLNDLKLIRNLAKYPHEDRERDSMFLALDEAVDKTKKAFEPKQKGEKESFSF